MFHETETRFQHASTLLLGLDEVLSEADLKPPAAALLETDLCRHELGLQ